MYQPIHYKNAAMLLTLASVIILCANISFAQVDYSTFDYPAAMGASNGPTGVRGAGGQDVYITGTWDSNGSHGLLYEGPLTGGGQSGQWTVLDFPSSGCFTVTGTVLYGPDAFPPNNVRLVGSYTRTETGCPTPTPTPAQNHGLLYEGPPDGSGTWQTLDFPPPMGETVLNTIPHSTMGGLVVGNFDTDHATGRAFVYDIDADHWVELIKPGAISITAYGIWYNGGTQYTIAGGYSDGNLSGIDHGYLVNWDSATQTASDWTSYDFNNRHIGVAVSHFNGITGDNHGGFYLTGDWVGVIPPDAGAFFAHVRRTPARAFGEAHWTPIAYPSSPGLSVDATGGDTVFENNVIGIYTANSTHITHGFVARVLGHR